ncbi:MAG: small subunit ribosomal protein S6 [Saprospiraceae bacterium]|jgi:small subunit ribosomal protein S6
MNQYEVTFIVDPVLSGDEIKATAQTYIDFVTNEGCTIVNIDEMGLRQLTYPINRRTSGIYYCIEFQTPNGEVIDKLELAFRRDESIMRFLSVRLDKYGVKFNEDRRNGLIGKKKAAPKKDEPKKEYVKKDAPKPVAKKAPVAPAPVVVEAPAVAAEAPVVAAEVPAVAAEVPAVAEEAPVVAAETPVAPAPVVETPAPTKAEEEE